MIAKLIKQISRISICSGNKKILLQNNYKLHQDSIIHHQVITKESDLKELHFKIYKTFIRFKIHASLTDNPQIRSYRSN